MPRRFFLMVIAFAVFVLPAVVSAAGGFTDVADTNVFKADIDWLAATGVTKGCNPPTNDKFCPGNTVTREQMAAFMHRLAANKVVDAKTAIDSDTLDGKHATDFLGATAKAADANLLDGSDSTAYRTRIVGVVCEGAKCGDPGNLTNAKILELTITAPASGYLQIDTSIDATIGSPTNDYVAVWLTLNGDTASFSGCEGSFLGIPLGANRILATSRLQWLDGNIFNANVSAAPVIAVSAGTNTIRLCGFSNVASDTYGATLSATWSAEGSATVLSSGSSDGPSDELAARLQAAVDG